MMAVEQTGYGMGMKDFTDANCLRAIIGNTVEGQEQTGCHGAVQEMVPSQNFAVTLTI